MMMIWLDDLRPIPSAYTSNYKTAEELISFLKRSHMNTKYMTLDLDHDLGENLLTGMDVLNFIEKKAAFDTAYIPPFLRIHTDNAAVRIKMEQIADK